MKLNLKTHIQFKTVYVEPLYNEVLLISMYFKLRDRAGLNTSFVTYEKRLPQPENKHWTKLRVVDIYKTRFNHALGFFWSLIFYSKPVPEYSFIHLLKLFYRIWLKRIESSAQWNIDRRGGKREGAGRRKSPVLTKITREINQNTGEPNRHSIYLEIRVFSS